MKPKIPSHWNTLFKPKRYKVDYSNIPDTVKPRYKNGVSDWVGRQLTDTKPILYVSSVAGSRLFNEKEFEELTNIKHRCFSYAYCGPTSPMVHPRHIRALDATLKRNTAIFLDSGAHSLHRMLRSGKTLAHKFKISKEQRKEFVEFVSDKFLVLYAEYVKWAYTANKPFTFWVTLDSQKDCSIIYTTTKRLEKLIGIAPVPVYHGDQPLSWVKKYIDEGHKIIGVGIDSRRIKGAEAKHRYYSELHELTEKHGVATHGFAITGDRMLRYPFYSVDSATHLKVAAFGKILQLIPEKQRIAQVHISNKFSEFTTYGNISSMSKIAEDGVKELVKQDGFDYKRLRVDADYRILYNAFVLHKAVELNTKKKSDFKTWKALV